MRKFLVMLLTAAGMVGVAKALPPAKPPCITHVYASVIADHPDIGTASGQDAPASEKFKQPDRLSETSALLNMCFNQIAPTPRSHSRLLSDGRSFVSISSDRVLS